MEKFQISVKNLNNFWSFIKIYAVFVLNMCGEKSVWRKNDQYEVCEAIYVDGGDLWYMIALKALQKMKKISLH